MQEEIKEIEIEKIIPNPEQSRKVEEEDIKRLAESMQKHGQLENIVVKKKDGKYILGAGEQRYQAGKLLGWKKIRALVKDVSDDELAEIALTENLCRNDLSSIQREHFVSKRWKSGKYKLQQDLAKAIGITPARVGQLLDAYELRSKIVKGQTKVTLVSTQTILDIKPLNNIKTQRRVIKMVEDGNLQASEVKEAVGNFTTWHKSITNTVLDKNYPYRKAVVRIEDNLKEYRNKKAQINKLIENKQTWYKAFRDCSPKEKSEVFRYLLDVSRELEPAYIMDLDNDHDKRWSIKYLTLQIGILCRLLWKAEKIDENQYLKVLEIIGANPKHVEFSKRDKHFYSIPELEWPDGRDEVIKNDKLLKIPQQL